MHLAMHEQAQSIQHHQPTEATAWKAIVAKYQQPHLGRALWQVVSTLGSYTALWILMYFTISWSVWLTLPMAVLAGGLLIRIFIIFHDCGHGSFFKAPLANDIFGFICGILTFTPYYQWRWEHAQHHATTGDLDRRGYGDVWTLTVQEYLAASRWKRFSYRLSRNPIVLFVFAPIFIFVVRQRFVALNANQRERRSVWWMNLAVVAMAIGLSAVFGVIPYLIIQLTALAVAGSAGVWLFYVQHQFEGAYWARRENWDYTAAAMKGSSFYKLPRVLQWFSGNIGFHHIHHLSPRIPNYNLERCHKSDPMFRDVTPMTVLSSLKSLWVYAWDESANKLVSLRSLRKRRKPGALKAEVYKK